MDIEPSALAALPMVIGGVLAALLTLVWMVVHVFGLVRVADRLGEVSQRTKIAWGLSAVGGFMGPCVIVMALVGIGLALMERANPEATEATRQAAGFVIAAGAIILVMTLILVGSALLGMALD